MIDKFGIIVATVYVGFGYADGDGFFDDAVDAEGTEDAMCNDYADDDELNEGNDRFEVVDCSERACVAT